MRGAIGSAGRRVPAVRPLGRMSVAALLVLAAFVVPGAVPAAAASCATTNVALNRPATASSLESSAFPASNAVDGNTGTRWSSAFSDPQWIYVDLQATYNITEVKLNWEAAYGKSYQIQISSDAVNWTNIYSTTTGAGGIEDLTGLSGKNNGVFPFKQVYDAIDSGKLSGHGDRAMPIWGSSPMMW